MVPHNILSKIVRAATDAVARARSNRAWQSLAEHPTILVLRGMLPARRVVSAVIGMVMAGLGFLVLAVAVYLVTVLFGAARGDALPTASYSFRVNPRGWVQSVERGLPHALIVMAAAGAVASALVGRDGKNEAAMDALRRFELQVLRGWRMLGWLVVPTILLFGISIGGWSGVARELDYQYASLFSLTPYVDAGEYLFASLNQATHGAWNQVGARRPLAQAIRDASLMLGGLSYQLAVVVQAVILGLAMSFAGIRLAVWRGVWAGIAFIGLMILQAKFLLPSMMTEPLGMIVALLGAAVLIDASKHRSFVHGLLALALLSLALSVRMGALFVLPALVLWLVFVVAPPERRWVCLMAAIAIVTTVVSLGKLLGWLYAPVGAQTGGNFAYTLCGLSVGGDWSTCYFKLYSRELAAYAGDEAGAVAWTLRQTLRNIAEQPSTFVIALVDNLRSYFKGFSGFYLHGYPGTGAFSRGTAVLTMLASIPGITAYVLYRAGRVENLLWAGIFAGILSSSAIIMADDGWRALHITHALTVLFLAMGFATTGALTTRGAPLSVRRWSIALVCGVLLLVVAPKGLRAVGTIDLACCHKPAARDTFDHVIGGRRLTGFVIVPDGTPRSPKVPSIPVGDFERIFRATFAKDADVDGIIATVRQRAPVAFVYAQPVTAGPNVSRDQPGFTGTAEAPRNPPLPGSQTYLLAPPSILARREVRYWKLEPGSVRTIPGPFMTVYDVGQMTAAP